MLPFIAGIATGVIGVIVYKNRDTLKEKVVQKTQVAQKFAQEKIEQSKELAHEIKEKIEAKKSTNVGCEEIKKEEEFSCKINLQLIQGNHEMSMDILSVVL